MANKTVIDVVTWMMEHTTERDLEDLAWCIRHEIEDTTDRYMSAYKWNCDQCDNFFTIIVSVCNRFVK